jgi:hypothetical protein
MMQDVWGRINLLLSFKTTRAAKNSRLWDTKTARRSHKPPPFLKASKLGQRKQMKGDATRDCTGY